MIGLVLVTHSAQLAAGVHELIEPLVQGRVPIATAGGTSNADAPLGTDPVKVLAAIEAAYSDDGVLVLMDLGSAVMSAEAAVEMLPVEQQAHVFLCEAPLVEGAVAAAVQAAAGSGLEQVVAEARRAVAAKATQLGIQPSLAPLLSTPLDLPDTGLDVAIVSETQAMTIVMPNRLGLHARPAARLVTLAGEYDAQIAITCHGRTVPATSMNQVATLGAKFGDTLTVRAVGPEAESALAAIAALAADNFGDPFDTAPSSQGELPAPAPAASLELAGVPASPGVAVGPVVVYRQVLSDVVERSVADSAAEQARLDQALAAAIADLRNMRSVITERVGAAEASIFDAHILMLQDTDLREAAHHDIGANQINAEAAWQRVILGVAARYRALEDVYLARRADDVIDVGQRVLRRLMGADGAEPILAVSEPSIVVAHDLKPSDVARLPVEVVLGIATELGGANGHGAILARALGIPAVTGVGPMLNRVTDGQVIALDAGSGRVWLAPDAALVATLTDAQLEAQAAHKAVQHAALQPAVLREGRRIEVGANINLPQDVRMALAFGADAVGVFRTEYLFMDRPAPPTEEEQLAAYLEAAKLLDDRPLIIRTLDAGGDKPLDYLPIGAEPNPFLGQRGLRYCLEHPGIFKPQLRAILRAAAEHPVKLMLPMVSTLDELILADALVQEACAELQEEGLDFDDDIETGIMIEVPSAVMAADQLARFVDFFSIGTNDLAQYLMAADRGNAAVANLINPFQPALLRAIRHVAQAAHAAGIWVGLCGELGGDPRATPLLLGLGVDELSMNAPSIPAVKARVRQLGTQQVVAMADFALLFNTAAEIEHYLTTWEEE